MPRPVRRSRLGSIAIDCETTGLDFRHGARPFLVTICNEDGINTYWEWPVDPLTRRVEVPRCDLAEIRTVVEDAELLVLQNAKFDVRALEAAGLGIEWPWRKTHDTLVAGHLLASNQPHDLASMALVYLKVNIRPYEDDLEKAVKEARKWARAEHPDWRLARSGLPEMPSAKDKTWKYDSWLPELMDSDTTILADYANADSAVTIKLWQRQMELIEERGLRAIYDESIRVPEAIYAMETHGVTMSRKRTEELKVQYTESSVRLHGVCVNLSDGEIKELPRSGVSNALKHVLFGKFRLKSSRKTPKGNASVDKYALDDWLATLPEKSRPRKFVEALKGYRKRQTALGYIESYQKFWQPIPGGSVPGAGRKELPPSPSGDWMVLYPSVNQTGTDTLRMSSSNPNEQQISKQGIAEILENGKEVERSARYMFGPVPGREWWSLDYQNLELRIPAYESGEPAMIDLFERPDNPPFHGSYHLLNASIIYPDLFWPLAGEKGAFKKRYAATWYQWCKNAGFALIYGCQEAKFDQACKRSGSYQLLRSRLPRLLALSDRYIRLAKEQGYVETLPDKTVDPDHGYPIRSSRSKWGDVSPTVPFNHHVQSTAMWCTRKAMVRCHAFLKGYNQGREPEARACLIMQIHDEMVFDFPARRAAEFNVLDAAKGGSGWSDRPGNLPAVRKIRRLMEQSGDDIGVPTPVSIEYHPVCWSDGAAV